MRSTQLARRAKAREASFRRIVTPAIAQVDRWLLQWVQRHWSNPSEAFKSAAKIAPPYRTLLQRAIKQALVATWRKGRDDASDVIGRVKKSRRWKDRRNSVVAMARELAEDYDSYANVSQTYNAWATKLGNEVWETKVKATRDVITNGFQGGWGMRNTYAYLDRNGDRVSAFEATGGRGGAPTPGFKRVLDRPGVVDQLRTKLSGHRQFELERIARTEATRAYNLGMRSEYDAEDTVVAYEFVAIVDSRTTEQCILLNRTIISKDDPRLDNYTPPLHCNCRSELSPVFAWDENIVSTLDDEVTRTLLDNDGNDYEFTYTPSRVMPMVVDGALTRAGLGADSLLPAYKAELMRQGFVAPNEAEIIAKVLLASGVPIANIAKVSAAILSRIDMGED